MSNLQVGSVSRSPPIKEDNNVHCSSPEADRHDAEAELLVSAAPIEQFTFLVKCKKLLCKVCSTHQFKNEQVSRALGEELNARLTPIRSLSFSIAPSFQVEMLYQRYFLKMNQSNMTNLITLLLIFCISIIIVAGTDLIQSQRAENGETASQQRLDKLVVLMSTSGCCVAIYGGKHSFF